MKIAGHTMGTPEYTVPEAMDLFARLGMEGIEAICHDEYRSAIRTGMASSGLQELRRRAEGQGLQWYPDLLPPAEIGMKAGAELVRRILKDLG